MCYSHKTSDFFFRILINAYILIINDINNNITNNINNILLKIVYLYPNILNNEDILTKVATDILFFVLNATIRGEVVEISTIHTKQS